MPTPFTLKSPVHGIAMESLAPGATGRMRVREALTFLDGTTLFQRLEGLHGVVFAQIPNLPPPSQIDNLVVTIAKDLSALAYVNELRPVVSARVGRPIPAGEVVYENDIQELLSYDLGIPIEPTSGVVVVLSHHWRRSLFWDFMPLAPGAAERDYDLSTVLAGLARTLIKGTFEVRPTQLAMKAAIDRLESLLAEQSDRESDYQRLLESNPWMLGGQHTLVERHTNLDERTIPDFTGVRARDGSRDIFEIKQPFLKCFLQNGEFSNEFLRAWEQAERYLWFARDNMDYLEREKGLRFRNPRCFLLMGCGLSEGEQRRMFDKERNNGAITLLSYEQVLKLARSLLALLEPTTISTP